MDYASSTLILPGLKLYPCNTQSIGDTMTKNSINVSIDVSSNGTTDREIKKGKELKSTYDAAASSAAKISAGTAGSRAVAAKAAPSGSERMMSGQDYRVTQSIGGSTSRDFAKQAQGLSGLVHLYATFAANIFAVSAAFTALKNAMDTTNLIKGLDALGANSGRSLGTLSKNIVEITGGAINLRDAMTSVANASSAGMSTKNIERMSLVAKNASIALGISMPDALNRLTRGIAKLEPELLDELGLFSKIGPSTEQYAQSIGKTSSQLTDFERRQAFANAVLEEGEKKFAALSNTAANPYDKLLASLQNVIQSGLELVNKVLAPIAEMLSKSPTALTAGLVGIIALLVKQAVPAVGQLRASLKASAEDALKSAEQFKASFGDKFQDILERRFKIPDIEADIKKTEKALNELKFTPAKMAPSLQNLVAGTDYSEKNIKALIATKNKIVDEGIIRGKQATDAQISNAKREIKYIQLQIDLYKQRNALDEAHESALSSVSGKPGKLDPENLNLREYTKLRQKADKTAIISNAAQTAQIAGVTAALALLDKELVDKGITGFQKFNIKAQGSIAAVGSRLLGLVGILGEIGMVIGVFVAGFSALDNWVSKNAKEMADFTNSVDNLDASVNTVRTTLAAMTDAAGFTTHTIANTVALSTAFNDLTDSAKNALKLGKLAEASANGWDNFWNGVFEIAGKGRESTLAKKMAESISTSIKLLGKEGLADEYTAQIKQILGVTSLSDIDKVAAAWKKLSDEQKQAVISIQENSNRALGNASASLQSFKDKTDEGTKAYKTLLNSYMDNSPLFKLGEALIQISTSLDSVIAEGPDRIAQAFEELANNTNKAALFGEDFVKSFASIHTAFKTQKAELDSANASLLTYKENLDKARDSNRRYTAALADPKATVSVEQGINARKAEKNLELANRDFLRAYERVTSASTDALLDGTKLLVQAKEYARAEGMKAIEKAIQEAKNAASILIGKALTVGLTGPQKLQADSALRQQELKNQLAVIDSQESLINIQTTLVDEMKLANALQEESNALQKYGKGSKEANAAATAATKIKAAATGDYSGLSALDKEAIIANKNLQRELQTKGLEAARINIRAQMSADNLSTNLQMPGLKLAQQQELEAVATRTAEAEKSRLDTLNSIAGISSKEIVIEKQKAEAAIAEAARAREIATIKQKLAQDEEALAKNKDASLNKSLSDQVKFSKDKLAATEKAQAAEKAAETAKNAQQNLQEELNLISKKYELEQSGATTTNELNKLAVADKLKELQLYSEAYNISKDIVINKQYELDKEQALLEAAGSRALLDSNIAKQREEAQAKINLVGKDSVQGKAVTEELQRQEELYNNSITLLNAQKDSKLMILDITKQLNLEQEAYNERFSAATDFANTLKTAFEGASESVTRVADALGSVALKYVEISKNAEDRGKAEKLAAEEVSTAREALNNAQGNAQREKALENLSAAEERQAKVSEKNSKAQLTDNIALIGSTKKLFKEKTVAYKTLDAIEKAMHIYKMAMFVKEVAMEMWAAGQSVVASATKSQAKVGEAGVDGVAGVVKAIASVPYPMNIVAGAMTAAAVAALLSQIGGSGPKAPALAFSPNSEQRQETQGTGMTWDAKGNKVETGRGVFGDSEARSESIKNSLEIMRDNSIEGLNYDNKMLKSMEKLSKALTGASQAIYAIPGLRQGATSFGTLAGSSSSGQGGLLGTGLLGGIFGGKTKSTTTIESAGIQLHGSLQDIINDTADSIVQYKDVLTRFHKSGGWFSKSRDWSTRTRETAAVTDSVKDSIVEVFKYSKEVFEDVAASASISANEVNAAFNSINFSGLEGDIDIVGMTGEEALDAINAVISTKLDETASIVFSAFDSYKKFGEGFLETTIRVIDANTKVDQALRAMGSTFDVTAGSMDKFATSEALVDLAGGLDNFMDQASYFKETFLSDLEQLVPVQKSVAAEMVRLNIPLNLSRQGFKELVLAQDLSTEAGRSMYQSLMDLAPGFATATEGLTKSIEETISKFTDFADKLKSFRDSLVLGNTSILTPTQKYLEAKTQYDETLQKALTGDSAAMGSLTNVASSFLSASRDLNASGAAYTRDFNNVLTQLATAGVEARATVDVATLQLNAATTQVSLLTTIDENIALIANGGKANGGLARGFTLVGERGPELVDFTSPGQVYTAEQTAGMFRGPSSTNLGIVVTELQNLRTEVQQLRKDQQKQTGDLIMSNYDANQLGAAEVSTAVVDTAIENNWKNRSKPVIR